MAKAISETIKAQAIAALLKGCGVNDVARQFGVDKATVSRWFAKLPSQQLQQIATEKKERLIDLVEGHLIASLKGATRVAEQAFDDQWRTKQPADQLAIFYGVLSDKSIKLVEVAGRVFADRIEQPAA